MYKFFKDYLYITLIIISCGLSVYLFYVMLHLDENSKLTIARFILDGTMKIALVLVLCGAIIIPMAIIFMIHMIVSFIHDLKEQE